MAAALPYVVWTIPELATVGASESTPAAGGVDVETGTASYRRNARGQIIGDTDQRN